MSSTAIAEARASSRTKLRPKRLQATITAVVLLAIYFFALWYNFHESALRTVNLEIPSHTSDHLLMHVNIVSVDLPRLEITARISFFVAGRLAHDEVTPETDLQLVLNTVRGQQEINFPRRKRMSTIEAVFPLRGEMNRYPLDRYQGSMWLLVTMPELNSVSTPRPQPKAKVPEQPKAKPPGKKGGLLRMLSREKKAIPSETSQQATEPVLPAEASALAAAVLTERSHVDTKMSFTASIPGLTFRGTQPIEGTQSLKGLTGIQINMKRSTHVISISVVAMLMMLALSIGVVSMTLRVLNGSRQMASFHAPMAVSLIFGLPALRNIQPGIPPPGTLGDVLAFTWAEVAAAGSAFALVIHWLLDRSFRKS